MIETKRLLLREFMEADYDDLYEFLSQLENDEFEGYPDITYENGIPKLYAWSRLWLQFRKGTLSGQIRT